MCVRVLLPGSSVGLPAYGGLPAVYRLTSSGLLGSTMMKAWKLPSPACATRGAARVDRSISSLVSPDDHDHSTAQHEASGVSQQAGGGGHVRPLI